MPRTAGQLRQAAYATGTFATFRGDGASVPYGMFPPPHNLTALLFKQYLDTRFPETFRLHDWLYSVDGALISATQTESDAIFLQEITPFDPVSASVVYLACQNYGSIYFGTQPSEMQRITPRRAQYGGSTVIYKITMLFQLATGGSATGSGTGATSVIGRRLAGWSESLYIEAPSLAFLYDRIVGSEGGTVYPLCALRAELLPVSAAIIGQRYQVVDPVGQSVTGTKRFDGSSQAANDIPQMALLCRVPTSSALKFRRLILRGIPDNIVFRGEYTPTATFSEAVQRYLRHMGDFRMRVNTTGPPLRLNQISEINVVRLRDPRPDGIQVGTRVTFADVQPATGHPVSGTWVVSAVSNFLNEFSIFGWVHGASTGGTVRFTLPDYPTMSYYGAEVTRVITRKVGRPFGGYVGRASAR